MDARASSKRAFDAKAKFKQIKIKVLLYLPSPPKGHNSKFYTPWRGIYHVIEITSPLTYIVRRKGGRKRKAHVNRLKFYNPMDSREDLLVKISIEYNEQDTNEDIQYVPDDDPQNDDNANNNQHYQGRITRSKTNSQPQQISRFSSSITHHPLINYSSNQYPWASSELVNNLKLVKILP